MNYNKITRRIPRRKKNKNNKSGYPGVYFDRRFHKYCVYGKIHNHQKYLGCFVLLADAIERRRQWEIQKYGVPLYAPLTPNEIEYFEKQVWPDDQQEEVG